MYLAFAGFTSKTEEFSPKTLPGRILGAPRGVTWAPKHLSACASRRLAESLTLRPSADRALFCFVPPTSPPGMIHAFAIFLTVSFYIANLATVLITAPAPYQPIKGIDSFSQLNAPACLGNKTAFTAFMAQQQPDVSVELVPGTVTSVLDAMLLDDPPCLGGVMTDVLFQYETGPVADPAGKYCSALMIGPQMGAPVLARSLVSRSFAACLHFDSPGSTPDANAVLHRPSSQARATTPSPSPSRQTRQTSSH